MADESEAAEAQENASGPQGDEPEGCGEGAKPENDEGGVRDSHGQPGFNPRCLVKDSDGTRPSTSSTTEV